MTDQAQPAKDPALEIAQLNMALRASIQQFQRASNELIDMTVRAETLQAACNQQAAMIKQLQDQLAAPPAVNRAQRRAKK